ncbi:MAG: cytochrome c oxidase assembly protein [Gemmatimonadota bacterium]
MALACTRTLPARAGERIAARRAAPQFFLTALHFWWVVLDMHARMRPGVTVVYLFTTLMQTGALGALLTLASQPWYPWYALHGSAGGIRPLQDQQLGGLIMWIPGGLGYLGAIIWTLARWMRSADHVQRDAALIGRHLVEPVSG